MEKRSTSDDNSTRLAKGKFVAIPPSTPASSPPLAEVPNAPAIASTLRPALWSRDFVLLLLVQLFYGTAFSSFFILPKYLIEALHADAALVGNAHGVFGLAGVVLVPAVGAALDRVGRRPLLLLGLLLGALSFGLFGLVHAPWLLLLLRVVHGISFALVFNAGAALAVDLAPAARRAEAIGYFGTAMLCTNAFGPLICELLAHRFSWQVAFYGCSAYAALALLLALRLSLQPLPTVPSGKISVMSVGLFATYLGSTALGIGVGASKTFVPAVLVQAGMPLVAPYFVAFTAGALFQRTLFGWLPDRVGHLRATVLALAAYAAAMFLVLTTPVPWVPAVSFGIGLAHGLGYPAIGALAISLGDPLVRGRITAWLTGGFNLGFALSTAGFARFEPELGYRGLVGLGAFCLLLSALAVPLLVRNHDQRQRARRACGRDGD